jgi:septum site-determining protein MinC
MPSETAVRSSPVPDPAPGNAGDARAAASSRPAIEFKGLSHPALRAILNDASPDALRHALIGLLDGDPDRFEWQPVVVDLSRLGPDAPLDWPEVLAALRAVRLHPVAVAGAAEDFREEANRLQLGWLAPVREPSRRAAAASAGNGEGRAERAAAAATAGGQASGPAAARSDAPAGTPAADPSALVVDRPVRSGQRIYARDADLVVIGPVSPGAEVIADGNVHVYGPLQGRAIAGARGRRGAAIFTLDLRAELVAVCGVYRTFEEGPPAEYRGRPVRIELDAVADKLSVRPL